MGGFRGSLQEVILSSKSTQAGIHFTPAPLARALVEAALANFTTTGKEEITILDPACGSGEFLRECARQLRRNGYDGQLHLQGFDKSRGACEVTRFLLGWEFQNDATVSYEIQCVDSLANYDFWPQNVDLILMNPPFVSWQDMGPEERQLVLERLGDVAGQRPDLASAFAWMAVNRLSDTGTLGSVLPASILDGTSHMNFRFEVGDRLALRLIARLGSHQIFPNALVDAALLVGSGQNQGLPTTAIWADHRKESADKAIRTFRRLGMGNPVEVPVAKGSFSIYSVNQVNNQDWAPRHYDLLRLRESVEGLPRVSDMFTVRQGVLSGRNKAFLLKEAQYSQLPKSEQVYFRRAIVNGSVVAGRIVSRTRIFYPYGESILSTEQELQERLPNFFEEVLEPQRHELIARPRKDETDWWTLAEYRAWQVPMREKILSTYFGGAGSFTLDEIGDHVVVQGYAWLPKKDLSRKFLMAYVAILNSHVFTQLLSASSNPVSSGAMNLSKRYVESIALPDFRDGATTKSDIVAGLAGLGESILADGLTSLDADQRAALDDFSSAAYGVFR